MISRNQGVYKIPTSVGGLILQKPIRFPEECQFPSKVFIPPLIRPYEYFFLKKREKEEADLDNLKI